MYMDEFYTLAICYKGLVKLLSIACKKGALGFVVNRRVVLGAVFGTIVGSRGPVKPKLLLGFMKS